MGLFSKKTIESIINENKSNVLNKTLGSVDLILLGLGAIIGTGVFILTGIVAARYSGPAVMLSYVIAGTTCIFVALAYTELASMLPTAGSIYTYSYVAFGEIFAWLMGSVIILELGFAGGAVAASWSSYMQRLLKSFNIFLPDIISKIPAKGGIIDLPAFCITIFIGIILFLGTKDSKKLNMFLVVIKMLAILAFVIFAIPHFNFNYWENFFPFDFNGVIVGGSILFFAFTGFATLATAAEECRDPKKDMTIGIIGSLIIATITYVIVGGLLTGIRYYYELNNVEAFTYALISNNSIIGSNIVAVGAICGITTVLMMNIYGTSRIFFVIARDGLIPKTISKLHSKYNSPYITIILFTILSAMLGGFCPPEILAKISSMGSLIDYIIISIIVMLFRIKYPNFNRPFKCPAIFIISPISLLSCIYLLYKQINDSNDKLLSGKILLSWFLIIFLLYIIRFFYKKYFCIKKHS